MINLKTAGIVCEYNPLHNGHIYHISETRKSGATHIVCVMSGNYVQRGECAFVDKWTRAEAAIDNGADLVVELPTPWSCDSAENFAFGALWILNALNIDMLSFGSETDDIELLKKCASVDDGALSDFVLKYIKQGNSYPFSFKKAVLETYGEKVAEVISSPNSTLAVEYLKAISKINGNIEPFPVSRKGCVHDSLSTDGEFISASAIRNSDDISTVRNYIPEDEFLKIKKLFENEYAPCLTDNAERAIISALRLSSPAELSKYADNDRGLCERICSASKSCMNLTELYKTVKTKNITMAKIRRSVMRFYLDIEADISKKAPPYIKVLAANEKGLEVLKKSKGNLPVITKHSDAAKLDSFGKYVYEKECRCTDLYALFSKKIRACGLEQTSSAKIIK